MTVLTIIVHGIPAPQGSKRAFLNKHTGKPVMTEQTSKRLKPWRLAVQWAAAEAYFHAGITERLDGPLFAYMVFTFDRPRSHYRTGRNAHLLRDAAPARPVGPPDLSKLARATEDALTDAGIWVDDARVVEYARLAKVYANEDRDALDRPGAVIRVWPALDIPAGVNSAPAAITAPASAVTAPAGTQQVSLP